MLSNVRTKATLRAARKEGKSFVVMQCIDAIYSRVRANRRSQTRAAVSGCKDRGSPHVPAKPLSVQSNLLHLLILDMPKFKSVKRRLTKIQAGICLRTRRNMLAPVCPGYASAGQLSFKVFEIGSPGVTGAPGDWTALALRTELPAPELVRQPWLASVSVVSGAASSAASASEAGFVSMAADSGAAASDIPASGAGVSIAEASGAGSSIFSLAGAAVSIAPASGAAASSAAASEVAEGSATVSDAAASGAGAAVVVIMSSLMLISVSRKLPAKAGGCV